MDQFICMHLHKNLNVRSGISLGVVMSVEEHSGIIRVWAFLALRHYEFEFHIDIIMFTQVSRNVLAIAVLGMVLCGGFVSQSEAAPLSASAKASVLQALTAWTTTISSSAKGASCAVCTSDFVLKIKQRRFGILSPVNSVLISEGKARSTVTAFYTSSCSIENV